MTKQELRETKDYKEAVDKIKRYSKDFTFTMNFSQIPKAKGNALKIILADMVKEGILQSISIGLTLEGEPIEETYKRL
jgi:hypothetical protein